ncbi:MAG TPA: sulfatase [Acidobacteriota bacterium]
MPQFRLFLLAAFCAAAVPAAASSAAVEAAGAAANPAALSLIWISLDTVRADHLQLYGYERETSPFLADLAQRGLYFEWAISPQNSTLPTHLTQFTGIHPYLHGVMHSKRNPGIRLADSVRTLPELLTDAGFRSRAWTDGGKMARHYGFARGFETYSEQRQPFAMKLNLALAALDQLEPGERFFFFIHTYEAHAPYLPPPPYRDWFQAPADTGGHVPMNRYDGSLRLIDDQLRRLIATLKRGGVLDRAVLVITGDHGENFNEYGINHIGHGAENLHQNLTRVPWIVLHPNERYRGRVSKLVGLVDFANTTLALLGLEERFAGQGIDVLAADAPSDRAYVSWTGSPNSPGCAWSIYSGDFHLLRCDDPAGPERNGLFHFRRDPLERSALDEPQIVADLDRQLTTWRDDLEPERARLQPSLIDYAPLDRDTTEALRALGYLEEKPEPKEPDPPP